MTTSSKQKIIHATLIVNPVSGKGDPVQRKTLIKKLAKQEGWVGKYIETTKEKSAGVLARAEIAKGVKHLVLCGGDGTIREALGAMLYEPVTFGIIPLGTGNLLAKNLSIPLEIEEAIKVALFGNPLTIDIGKVNKTYFCVIAGVGLDAEIMQGTNRAFKDKWGILAYLITGVKKAQQRPIHFEVTLDKNKPFEVHAKSIMAANMGKLMTGVEVVPASDPQSGTLQLGILKARTARSFLNIFAHLLTGRVDNSPHYDLYKAKKIIIRLLGDPRIYECDGNHFPPTDKLLIEIFHKAINILTKPDSLDSSEQKNKKVLLFDFDGTLADSLDMVIKIYNSLAQKYQYSPLSKQKSNELRGMSAREILSKLPISKIKIPLLYAEGSKKFSQNFEYIKPFNGLSEILSHLSRTYTLGIVTSNDSTNVKKFLLNHTMDYFDFVYSDGSLFGKGKIIKNVLKKYHFAARDVIYIGDEVRDIEAAREAKIKVISVTWGFNSRKVLRANRPDGLIDTPGKLTTLLPSVWSSAKNV